MKTKLLTICLFLTTVFLSGCAGKNNIYGGLFGQGVSGNKNYVTISNVWNEMDALPLAEEHCAQYSRSASFKSQQGYRVVFDCVD